MSGLFQVSCDLLFTLRVDTSTGRWIGYQLLTVFSAGCGVQIPFIASQVVLSSTDMPSGSMSLIHSRVLHVLSVCRKTPSSSSTRWAERYPSRLPKTCSQTRSLVKDVPKHTTGISGNTILNTDATHLRESVPADQLHGVLVAYNDALDMTFILPIAMVRRVSSAPFW